MSEQPRVVSSEPVHDGWIALHIDTIRYPSGAESTIDVVEHPGGVTLIAFDDHERLLLVRQYRHPAGRDLIELPADTLDPDETPEICAARELQEETGYRAERLDLLGGFFLAPGYCTEYQYVFLASGLSESKLEGDEEDLRLVPVPLDEALRMIAAGEIEDAKTLAALLLLQRVGGGP